MNSENSKIPRSHKLSFNFTDKIDLRRCEKDFALSNLIICYTCKI